MPERKHKVGDRVMAKWPKSSLFFEGVVEDYNDVEYLVAFDDPDESKLAIKYRDVQVATTFKSRSSSRGRSPGRPAKKSPARKSPARAKAPSKSPARRVTKTETKTEVVNTSQTSSRGSRSSSSKSPARVKANSTSPIINASSIKTPMRISARIASMEKNNDVKMTTTTVTTTTTRSSSRGGKSEGVMSKITSAASYVWGITLPVLTTLPMFLFVVSMPVLFSVACTKKSCNVTTMPTIPTSLSDYYDSRALYITSGLMVLGFVLSFLPIKSRVLPNGAKARSNGMVSLILACLTLVLAHYLKYSITGVCLLTRQLAATFTVFGMLLAIVLYIKSFYAKRSSLNPRLTKHFLPDFFEGREVAPRFLSVDIKSYIFRTAIIASVMFNILLMLREYQLTKGTVTPLLAAICGMQIVYSIDWLWFESSFYTTFEYTKQGTGLLVCAGYMAYPFFNALYAKYVFSAKPVLPWYCVTGIVLLFLVGYILTRGANNQKHAFRTNPSDPKLANLESIPTSAGSRLIVSGFWGIVRHPNYLGELIMMTAYSLCCGFSLDLPWLLLFVDAVYLMFRVKEVEDICQEKYGHSWNTYTTRVKSKLIPKVY